ncbi:hypothetical protein CFC21_031663, partial [Triticum aestivum]
MAKPPRHTLTMPSAHPRGIPTRAIPRAAAALFFVTLVGVALPLAVLHRAAVSRHSLEDPWGRYPL